MMNPRWWVALVLFVLQPLRSARCTTVSPGARSCVSVVSVPGTNMICDDTMVSLSAS